MSVFFSLPTLESTLELKALDLLFLDKFNAADDMAKQKILQTTRFEVITRIACNNAEFELFCCRPELRDCWDKVWCAYGMILSDQQQVEPVRFFSHPKSNCFNLARGAYFFNLAMQIPYAMKKDFSYSELAFLKQAMQFDSVHAIQRYNEFLYQKLQTNGPDSKNTIYNEIIQNSKKMLPTYGSYGYMALTEALARYAFWLAEIGDEAGAQNSKNSALKALDFATAILDVSKFSIHNASLGRGLAYSNSFRAEKPDDAKAILENYIPLHSASSGPSI